MDKQQVWDKQGAALRDPIEVMAGGMYQADGVFAESLEHTVTDSFVALLEKLKITLFVTREYEHLAFSLSAKKKKLRQGFIHLPHPSGLAINRKDNSVYIAATRNPNQIIQFKPLTGMKKRIDVPDEKPESNYLMPARTKFFAGAYYFHDLAVVDNKLYGNSVGQNGILKVDFETTKSDQLVWWPKCIEENGKPNSTANFIQLNSISGGESIEDCYFSASSAGIDTKRPGDLDYSVDKRGVIFSGRTREVFGTGLTRPHSSRQHEGNVWVDNSGYGDVGIIQDGKYKALVKLPGWTRGLCIKDGIMFVGVSRVLPKFSVYAPGLKHQESQTCGVYAVDMKTLKVLGSIVWPYANQIFAIDWIDNAITDGFIFDTIQPTTDAQKHIFYRYEI